MARKGTSLKARPRATKADKLIGRLRRFVASNPEGTRLPSFAELRREHGLSQDTVERALDELDRSGLIRRESRKGVYVARNAKLSRIGIVFGGEILSPHVSPVYRILLEEIRGRVLARQQSFEFFFNIRETNIEAYAVHVAQALVDALDRNALDGVILLFTQGSGEVRWLADRGVPLVVMTNVLPEVACGAYVDLHHVARLGVEALCSQGCRRIAMLAMSGHQRNQGFTDDLDAYDEALSEAGLERRPEWVWDKAGLPSGEERFRGPSNEEIGYYGMRDLLLQASTGRRVTPDHLPFDGLVSTDDMATRGILACLREFDITPGRDLKLASHINRGSPALFGYERDVTLIEVDPAEVAGALLSLLDRLTGGERIAPGTIELTGARLVSE